MVRKTYINREAYRAGVGFQHVRSLKSCQVDKHNFEAGGPVSARIVVAQKPFAKAPKARICSINGNIGVVPAFFNTFE